MIFFDEMFFSLYIYIYFLMIFLTICRGRDCDLMGKGILCTFVINFFDGK